jgi:hypothetical protein
LTLKVESIYEKTLLEKMSMQMILGYEIEKSLLKHSLKKPILL